MESTSECILCNLDQRYVIGESSLSFATYFPRAIKRGHFVVAVKEHIPTFTGLSPEQASDLFAYALKLAKVAERLLGAEKFYVAAIGDKDHHFHIHMLPKQPGDAPMGRHIMLDEGWKGEVGQTVTDADVRSFVERLRKQVD